MRIASLVVVVLLPLVAVACNNRQNLQCTQSSSCDLSGGGTCLTATSGSMWCAYPDPDCASGFRYSTQDVGDGLGGVCVPAGTGSDGGINTRALTLTLGGSGTGTVTSNPAGLTCSGNTCVGTFAVGAHVDLSASASSGSFLGWSLPCTGNGGCSLTLEADSSLSVLFGTPGEALWAQQVGGTGTDNGYALATTAKGDLIAVGNFSNSVIAGASTLTSNGGTDIYVMKFDAKDGNVLWAKSWGGATNDVAHAVAVDDSDNIYVAGSFTGSVDFGAGAVASVGSDDAFALKLTSDGAYVWAKDIGGTDIDHAMGIAVRDGAVAIAGSFRGTMTLGSTLLTSAGVDDVFVSKLTTDGAFTWSRSAGGSSADVATSVALDGSGNVVIAGYFFATSDFGGGPLVSAGSTDIVLAKYASGTGAYQVARRFGSTATDVANAVAIDPSNNIVLVGGFSGTVDFGGASPLIAASNEDVFVAKYSLADAYVWAKGFGGTGDEVGNALAINSTGDIVVAGGFCGTISFGGPDLSSASGCANYDIFAARLAADGSYLNSTRAGGAGSEVGLGVAQTADGRFYTTGFFTGFAEFGGQAFTALGRNDAFVLGLAPL